GEMELAGPVGREPAPAWGRARGMAGDVRAARITAEASRVAVHPGDRAAHLVGDGREASADVLDRREVRHDEVGAGANEQLGRERVVFGEAGAPGAAVDEYVDRRVGPRGRVEVEALDRCRAVREAARRAEPRAGGIAVGGVTPDDLLAVRRPDSLVVGGVELGLIEVEPDARPLRPRERPGGLRLLCERGAAERRHRAGRRGVQRVPAREANGPITGVSQSPDGAAPTGAPLRTLPTAAAPADRPTAGPHT